MCMPVYGNCREYTQEQLESITVRFLGLLQLHHPEQSGIKTKIVEVEPIASPEIRVVHVSPVVIQPTFDGVTLASIIKTVAMHYKLSELDMISHRRTNILLRARHVYYYLSRSMTIRTLPQIAQKLGGRDHTTAMHGVNKCAEKIKIDPEFANEVDIIRSAVHAGCTGMAA